MPCFDTPKSLGITHKKLITQSLRIHKRCIDSPPLLCFWAVYVLDKLTDNKVFDISEISINNYLQILNEYYKYNTEILEILLDRNKKKYSREKAFYSLPFIEFSQDINTNDSILSTEANHSSALSSYIDSYLETKVKDGKKDIRLIPELKQKIRVFLSIIGDKPITSYTREDFRKYRDSLKKLPPRFSINRKLKDKTIHEILNDEHTEVLAAKTVNEYTNAISTFFKWLVVEGYLTTPNFATNLNLKKTQAEIDSRDSFTVEDIQFIFTHSKFSAYKTSKTPSMYWIPFIALYTGMRLEEIAQLACKDIYQVDGLWVIDINTATENKNDTKNLKSVNANRVIPIHKHLQELGLLDYLEKIKTSNSRLFPELTSYGNRQQYGKAISKKFGPFVKSLGITGKKNFSFFTTFFQRFL